MEPPVPSGPLSHTEPLFVSNALESIAVLELVSLARVTLRFTSALCDRRRWTRGRRRKSRLCELVEIRTSMIFSPSTTSQRMQQLNRNITLLRLSYTVRCARFPSPSLLASRRRWKDASPRRSFRDPWRRSPWSESGLASSRLEVVRRTPTVPSFRKRRSAD